jgi:hypothetical protein
MPANERRQGRAMMVCIIGGDGGSCPPSDWTDLIIPVVLILAIAGFKAWKVYLKRVYPLERDFDD